MRLRRPAWLLPGLLALQRGQAFAGVALVSAALAVAAGLPVAWLVAPAPAPWLLGLVAAYALLVGCGLALDRASRPRPLDAAAVRAAHRAVVRAWIGGTGDARAGVVALTALAPREPGAWLLAGLIADQSGDARLGARARATVRRLGQRPLPGLPVEPEAP